jgi:hypothetical protein
MQSLICYNDAMVKFSEEHKKKLSDARKKYLYEHPEVLKEQSKRTKKLVAQGKMGFAQGNSMRKGVDPWNKGKTAKEDPRILKHANLIDKATGRPFNYKGGRKYFTQKERLKIAAELRQWRNLVFIRDNYTCQICFARNGNGKRVALNADHIKSFVNYPDLRLDIDNGRTLCIDCHRKTDNFGGKLTWSKEKL